MKKVSHQKTETLEILSIIMTYSSTINLVSNRRTIGSCRRSCFTRSVYSERLSNKQEWRRPKTVLFRKKESWKGNFFGIFWNFVPNITVTYNDQDTICINKKIQSKRKSKNKLCKIYMKNGRNWNDFSNLENSITVLNELLSTTKESYYEHLVKKLNNPTIQT